MIAGTDDVRVRDGERTMGDKDRARWLQQVRREYLEMPGLHLTLPQMRRLWGLSGSACETLVNALVEQHFLTKAADDSYVLRRARG
jgi:DNA-binding IclR family transcriptional regulator